MVRVVVVRFRVGVRVRVRVRVTHLSLLAVKPPVSNEDAQRHPLSQLLTLKAPDQA